jgi:guanylate kinase
LNEATQSGNLIIVSGPSGAGKSALAANVLRTLPHLEFSVSYTTRAPRGKEQDGVEYFFVSRSEFQSLIRSDDLLEWAEVHGNMYGTSRRFVNKLMEQGEDVLLDIDVQGAQIIGRKCADAVGIFIMPPSYEALKDRLRSRSLDNAVAIEQRLKMACREIRHYKDYDYVVINDNLDGAARELRAIILSVRCRMTARIQSAKSILATFGGIDAEDP